MKKWIIASVIALAVIAVGWYYFIPDVNGISLADYIGCNTEGAFRKVSEQGDWGKWWPGESDGHVGRPAVYRLGGNDYKVLVSAYPLIDISIVHNGEEIRSRMSFSALGRYDSTAIYWQVISSVKDRGIARWKSADWIPGLKNDMENVLSHLKEYLENSQHIYGMSIYESSTKDTFLIATRSLFKSYPGTDDIYGMVGRLRAYAAKEGAFESGYPMLNVTKVDSGYQVMTALPVDRELKGAGNVFYRRLVPGKFLVGDVKGGEGSVDAGLEQMRKYISDHGRTVMAIPFLSLITDRLKVSDSNQWVTRLYYPVY